MASRFLLTTALGVVTAFGLFWVMQALISVSGELKEGGGNLSVDFVRLKRDTAPEAKKREPPKREKPDAPPPPPQMNMAKAMNPGEAVGEIVPMVDTGMELEKATSLSAGGADSDVVPLVRVDPEYPPRARQQGLEGWVDLEFTISPVGTVQDARVIRSQPTFVFDRAALKAVRRWRYNPKVENGVAVARAGVKVRLRFELQGGR
ncbi:MAG: energy transducer TonB [Myxococcota bacterium]|nr:energy transducer TonB [Myxococcota bacterium]